MPESRIHQLAQILIDHSLNVQPGEKVILASNALARPLLMEVLRLVTRRGAEGILDITFSETPRILLTETPEDRLDQIPETANYIYHHADCLLTINAPENACETINIAPERKKRAQRAMSPLRQHVLANMRWVVCNFPTPALAQEARVSLEAYEDLLYNACLLNWKQQRQQLTRIKEVLDNANIVEILSSDTELILSLSSRVGTLGDGVHALPDGEVSWSPLETRTEGKIRYNVPALYTGQEVSGIELEFAAGCVVKARADQGESLLLATLDTDKGARVLGEFGIGSNSGITHYTKNILFDEKMDGTIHLALGASAFLSQDGKNVSALHWDMIKDMRQGGEIRVDGRTLLKNGHLLL